MGLRAYLIVNVIDEKLDQREFVNQMRELEDMQGVDFVDPVIGSRDLVMMVDAPVSVDAVAANVKKKEWVKDVEILRIVSLYERHCPSKKELLKTLPHSGLA